MPLQQNNYNICLISFSDLALDGRSRNFINAFKLLGKSVLTISLASVNKRLNPSVDNSPLKKGVGGCDCKGLKPFVAEDDSIQININTNQRFFRQWIEFIKNGKKLKSQFSASIYFASDLYALALAVKLANKNTVVIYDSREVFSALGPMHNDSFKQNIISQIEKRLIRRVDKFIASGELDREFLIKHFKTDKPFYVIKNFPFYTSPINSNLLREKFQIEKSKKILLYQGVLLEGRGIMPMLELAKLRDDIAICLIGDGKFRTNIDNYTKLNELHSKVHLTGNIEYSQLHTWTCSADIGMALIEPISFSYELALPNKLFEYLQAGLPVIATDLPAMKDIIEKYHCGIAVSKNLFIDEISRAIDEILNNYEYYHSNALIAAKDLCFDKQIEIIREIITITQ
ncbi:MAG: glycosyltransferase [Candidatus Kapabacteria bacterium]|nr:glycosyltransferase [Candidatus Kapabacteria bacterium]